MIAIDDQYRIETEANNYILKYEYLTGKINKKTGKPETSRNEWYFPTLELALKKYTNESLKTSESLEEIKEGLKRINTTITNLKN